MGTSVHVTQRRASDLRQYGVDVEGLPNRAALVAPRLWDPVEQPFGDYEGSLVPGAFPRGSTACVPASFGIVQLPVPDSSASIQ